MEIAALRDVQEIYRRALDFCLQLTSSEMGFVDLLNDDGYAMDVVAIEGFRPASPSFYERFRSMPVRPSVFGVVITENRPHISNDVAHDPLSVGTPPGHPEVRTFLGVPLRVGDEVIGMLGVSNKPGGYGADDERLLSTFANQVAVAIDNARLYQRQQEMIAGLQQLQRRLGVAERDQLLALERDRIAAAFHDDIEQQLFTAGLHLNALLDRDPDDEIAERLSEVRRIIGQTAEEVREVIFALAVEGHAGGDLTSSARGLLHDIARAAGLETDLVVAGAPSPAVGAVQGAVRAVIKQALTNVVKHAQARMVLVSIRYDPDRLTVVIQDDGVGAPDLALHAGPSSMHLGLRNMRRQIETLGGTIDVANGDESGLTVSVHIPLAIRPT
ncbi:MAG TPA: GAF domain-containing protein [Acidimicrobiales bacterium]|nr:GAF domain-containing protein [Acidimicrobiales bacterium]